MIEGGARVNTQFLSADLVDELQLAVAPFLVGNAQARRFVDAAEFPWDRRRRATLAEIREVGDMALLRYAFSARFQTADGMQQGTS
jgi:5-amino-6-(5-phosphoribosylamino)uracil reductase